MSPTFSILIDFISLIKSLQILFKMRNILINTINNGEKNPNEIIVFWLSAQRKESSFKIVITKKIKIIAMTIKIPAICKLCKRMHRFLSSSKDLIIPYL